MPSMPNTSESQPSLIQDKAKLGDSVIVRSPIKFEVDLRPLIYFDSWGRPCHPDGTPYVYDSITVVCLDTQDKVEAFNAEQD